MSEWSRGYGGVYELMGHGVVGLVSLENETWISIVCVRGMMVDRGEWEGRDVALRNAKNAMKRACSIRRFESGCPRMPEGCEEEDEDDCDD